MKLLIKYPSRARYDLFFQTLDNIFSTAQTDFKILISLDEDDENMNIESVKQRIESYGDRVIVRWGKSLSKIDAVNRDMVEALDWEWDWLVLMSDDMKFKVEGWDKKMMEEVEKRFPNSTDWFGHFNDGFCGHRLATMSVMGREYYERFYYIYPPCYKSIQCDGEVMFVAMMLQRYFYCEDVFFWHEHAANMGSHLKDWLYAYNERYGEGDIQIYEQRKKKLFYVNNPSFRPLNPDGSWEGEQR